MKPDATHRPPETPSSIRLVRSRGAQGTLPPPPLGLAAFSEAASAPAVAIELAPLREARTERERAMQIAAELPSQSSLPAGTLVVVLGDASPSGGFVKRLLKRDREPVSRAARATALLARGFTEIGAAHDEASGHDLVWGFTSPCS
jgi:hypothetical protein